MLTLNEIEDQALLQADREQEAAGSNDGWQLIDPVSSDPCYLRGWHCGVDRRMEAVKQKATFEARSARLLAEIRANRAKCDRNIQILAEMMADCDRLLESTRPENQPF